MAILTRGTKTSEIESALSLSTAVNTDTADGKLVTMIDAAVEAYIQEETRRNWESLAYTDEAFDIEPGQCAILLTDRPVTIFTSLKEVLTLDPTTGAVATTYTILRDQYRVNMKAGIVESIAGAFPYGPQAMLATFTAGYLAAEISGSTKREIKILKHLMLSIIQREYKMRKEGLGHMSSMSFGEESASLQFNLTSFEAKLLNLLKLGGL